MNSPHTGKPMRLQVSTPTIMEIKSDAVLMHFLYYECADTKEQYTDEVLDTLNLYQAYQLYAEKHNLPLEEVIPKP